MMLTEETEALNIDHLMRDGSIAIGNIKVELAQRASERLIISFFQSDYKTGWLNDVCIEEDFSELRLTAQTSDAFETPEVLAMLGDLAKDQRFAGTKITLCAAGEVCRFAVAATQKFKDPVTVFFDPSDSFATDTALVFFDPFTASAHATAQLGQWLKCFASNGDSAATLERMHLHRSVLPAALQGELDPTHYYALLRKRRDYRFYRLGVENALKTRGKPHRIPHFRDAFRARRITQTLEIDALQKRAAEDRPKAPGTWARLRRKVANTPSESGNAWMLQSENGRLRYLSDRWQGNTMGYVEQDGVTLAETPETAIGIAAFGDGLQVERPLTRRFPWHVVDSRLDGSVPAFGATAEATLSLEQLHTERARLVTALAISTAQPGITAGEALPGTPKYREMIAQIETACDTLIRWEKSLVVDRLRLCLLTGAPHTTEGDAALHYRQVALSMSNDIRATTTQTLAPTIVIVPQAGHRNDGASEVSLAEARFDVVNPTLDIVIPTAAYPFSLMNNMPATHTPEAALLMDELCMLAVRARQNEKPWHCPQLQFAEVSGTTITAQFSTLDGLVLEDTPHGFHLIGGEAPSIKRVEVTSDNEIKMELDDAIVQSGQHLAYAWGHQSDRTDSTYAANHGAVRDRWQLQSTAIEGRTLHRYALPARVPLHLKV